MFYMIIDALIDATCVPKRIFEGITVSESTDELDDVDDV